MNIRIVFYSLFRSPVQKTVMCPSFFFKTLKFEIFSNQNPDHLVQFLELNHENGLTASLLFEMKVSFYKIETRPFAIISKLYANPLARMLVDKIVDIVQLGRAYASLVAALEAAAENPQALLEGSEEKHGTASTCCLFVCVCVCVCVKKELGRKTR